MIKLSSLTKWRLVNLNKYRIIPYCKSITVLTDKEYESAQKIFEEKGNISYEFIPNGIGAVVKIKIIETGEIIDITDIDSW